MESMPKQESIEAPEYVYHGSVVGEINVFEPRKRFTPGGANVPPRVYAAMNPAFAAAHSFQWTSDEGIDLSIDGEKVVLRIPKQFEERLHQPVFIYKLKGNPFVHTTEDKTGETFHTEESVQPEEVQKFDSVTEALLYYGGVVEKI